MFHKYEGFLIHLERKGEVVEGKLRGSDYGPHYNVEWTDSEGQGYIGLVEQWEIEEAERKGWVF